jgi:hypothetical protein
VSGAFFSHVDGYQADLRESRIRQKTDLMKKLSKLAAKTRSKVAKKVLMYPGTKLGSPVPVLSRLVGLFKSLYKL